MGNCMSNRRSYTTMFLKQQKIQIEYAFQKSCLHNPDSRKFKRLFQNNFLEIFHDNTRFGEQLYWFMEQFQKEEQKGVDYDTFLQIVEILILGKSDNIPLIQLNRVMLIILVIVCYGKFDLEDDISYVEELEVSYFQIYSIVHSILRMVLQKKRFDERPVKALTDSFQDVHTCAQLQAKLLHTMPNINSIIENYFSSKLLNGEYNQAPTLQHPSYVLNGEWVSLFYCTFFPQDCSKMSLIYSTNVHERNFELLSNLLTHASNPTLIVVKCANNHVFGGFSVIEWRDDAQPAGSKDDCLYQLSPKFKWMKTKNDKFVRPQFTYLNSKNDDLVKGVGFGGELGNNFRLFINEDLTLVQCGNHDKTFEPGELVPKHLKKSEIEVLEVWSVEAPRGTTHLKDFMKAQQEEEIQVEEFSQAQIHLDEDISSYRSGDHESLNNSFKKQDSNMWDNESHHGFEEEIIIKQNGEVVEIQKNKQEFETIKLDGDEDQVDGHVVQNGDMFQEVQIEAEAGSMQASTFDQEYNVKSQAFGSGSEWNGESSDWQGNGSITKSTTQVSRIKLSKDLATITEELKESTNTQY